MFGNYQKSNLRLELDASASQISESLTVPDNLKQWLWPQHLSIGAKALSEGEVFSSTLGPALGIVKVNHQVEALSPKGIRFLLSGSIDGFHEWQWGDGWVQSRIEGISLLPLSLGQTLGLTRLKQHLSSHS